MGIDLTPFLLRSHLQWHVGEVNRLFLDDVWYWTVMFLLCTAAFAAEVTTNEGREEG